jgi:hypothetical protein
MDLYSSPDTRGKTLTEKGKKIEKQGREIASFSMA